MENTTPHLKSSPSPSFVFFRFAILGQSNRIRATVADPDLQIRGECGHPDPEARGRPALKIFFFRPFGPYFGLKIREGGRAPSLDPPLGNT